MIYIECRTGKRVRRIEEKDKTIFYRYVGEQTVLYMRSSVFDALYRLPFEDEKLDQLNEDELFEYGMNRLNERLVRIRENKEKRLRQINDDYARRIERKQALIDEDIKIVHRVEVKRYINIYYNINDKLYYKLIINELGKQKWSAVKDYYNILLRGVGVQRAAKFIADRLSISYDALYYMMLQIRRIELHRNRDKINPLPKKEMTIEDQDVIELQKKKAEEFDKQLEKELKQMKKDARRYY